MRQQCATFGAMMSPEMLAIGHLPIDGRSTSRVSASIHGCRLIGWLGVKRKTFADPRVEGGSQKKARSPNLEN